MRPLNSHFPAHALPTFETVLKQTQAARGLRRAQAVREVVAGHQVNPVSATFHVAHAALSTWVQRLAQEGPQGVLDRPRSGRPPQGPCALAPHLQRLIAHDPLEHGSRHAPWRGRELATVCARATGVPLGRDSGRRVLKNRREAPSGPPGALLPLPRTALMALWHARLLRTTPAVARSLGSMQTQRSAGVSPCPAPAGGAKPHAHASPYAR
jgi:transposase